MFKATDPSNPNNVAWLEDECGGDYIRARTMEANELMDRAESLHNETVPLCKDCKHYEPNAVHKGKCRAPQNIVILVDYVNGGTVEGDPKSYYSCNLTRKDETNGCGHEAKWFEPKS